MNKLKLKPDATFKHTVLIPVSGSRDGAAVEFEFKHRSLEEMDVYWEGLDDRREGIDGLVDIVMDAVCGWDLQEPFNRENVSLMINNYPASASTLLLAYREEILRARVGN